MKSSELWKLGMLNVFAAPVRSFLTVLGMAIGIAAILAVLTLGNAGQIQVRSEMNRLGIDKVWIRGSTFTQQHLYSRTGVGLQDRSALQSDRAVQGAAEFQIHAAAGRYDQIFDDPA